jgi:hypothetical protein
MDTWFLHAETNKTSKREEPGAFLWCENLGGSSRFGAKGPWLVDGGDTFV